jgi:CheY-like chemotaxis protein
LTDVKRIAATAADRDGEELPGTTFWHTRRPARAQSARACAPFNEKQTVLVVDHAPMMRGVLAHVLRQLGYRVVEASGTVEAQRLAASSGEIHLMLLDHSVPERTDLESALWFRAMYPEMKILVACVSLWDLNDRIGQEQQINFLAKPFTAPELGHMVRRVLKS